MSTEKQSSTSGAHSDGLSCSAVLMKIQGILTFVSGCEHYGLKSHLEQNQAHAINFHTSRKAFDSHFNPYLSKKKKTSLAILAIHYSPQSVSQTVTQIQTWELDSATIVFYCWHHHWAAAFELEVKVPQIKHSGLVSTLCFLPVPLSNQPEGPGLGEVLCRHAVQQDFHPHLLPAGVYPPPPLLPRPLPPAHRPQGCGSQRGQHYLQVRHMGVFLGWGLGVWEGIGFVLLSVVYWMFF